ncbi:MAG: UDP-N-acetylglucosamine 2-epimerase [Flavobacteriales bacterium]|nr:UDP-N-acetylglucosamine 2-epimerase [Flavobacteriales bacterium]
MRKICVVIGTRAQLIKMAPVIKELENSDCYLELIYTGQHTTTMQSISDNFNLPKPNHYLYRGKEVNSIPLALIWLIKILFSNVKLIRRLRKEKFNFTLVHGDTFSTVLGAIMGKLIRSEVAHVESGLRSFKLFNPFPEEINRLITFRLSDLLFCPGEWALNNVKKYAAKKINTIDNTVIDALELIDHSKVQLPFEIRFEQFCILSIHRFETIFNEDRLKTICKYASNISQTRPIVFILHPPTERALKKKGLYEVLKSEEKIQLYPRLDYFTFNSILKKCEFVLTDGGSNQEECYHMDIPCLLLREQTERQEGIGENVVLSKFDENTIKHFINNYKEFKTQKSDRNTNPSKLIVHQLIEASNG